MFSSAFKSFSSNIGSNYEVSKQPSANVGVWTIFDAKKKSTGAAASLFTFDRKALDAPSSSNNFGARASATSVKKAQDEVVDRLKKEASSLARLRHPSILQLVEPVEETRGGGLMFATEPVVASLSGALQQKDSGSGSYRGSYDARASQDVELDDLEIQKGLLQVAKGLEFLHESAKLVHGNLTPDAIFINAKSDWKISGLAFAGPPDGVDGTQSMPHISLSELLYHDSRLPKSVQLNLDYTSPDFVLDSNINFAADMFSLGLLLLACYRTPHVSPIETHGNQSTYKKILSSSSTAPTPSNNYLSTSKLPQEIQQVLPRILTRRPAQRMNASEFQQSEYFDNILVNTMRFLDGLPAKSPAEKSQFMRGLTRVMPQFPVSVLSKKVMSALLDELKDRDLLNIILQNIFQILKMIPNRQDVLSDKVLPKLTEIFLNKPKSEERDSSKEAGLVVFLENIGLISENCSAKQFKDDALPILHVAMESSTHSLVDAALSTLAVILPVLDFSTVKHDLFPVIAGVFSKTSSLGIKVRGLEALGVLCGATEELNSPTADDLTGMTSQERQNKNTSSLDKFTMQEKVIPLVKAIKTKEPAVMMAALKVLKQIAIVGDIDFLAIEVMPILWAFSLGPLLDLKQFKSYMTTIRSISDKIEREQVRKLQELSSSSRSTESRSRIASSSAIAQQANGMTGQEDDFEKLVLSGRSGGQKDIFAGALSEGQRLTPNPPNFSWSSGANNNASTARPQAATASMQVLQPTSRSITPDVAISSFPTLQPNSTSSSAVWGSQTNPTTSASRLQSTNYLSSNPAITAASTPVNPWQASNAGQSTINNTSFGSIIAPPPQYRPQSTPQNTWQQPTYNIGSTQFTAPVNSVGVLQPQSNVSMSSNRPQAPAQPQQQKSGLDKYESLL